MTHYGRVATASNATKTGTIDIAFSQPVPAGHKLMLGVVAQGLSGQDGPFTATDTKGNTWTERAHVFKSGTLQVSLLACPVTTALTTSDLIHLSHPAADLTLWAAAVHDFDGVTDFDTSASSSGASTTMNVGPTPGGVQDVELCFAVYGYGGADDSFSPGIGYTAGQPVQVTNGTNYRNIACEWSTTNGPGTRSASATSLSSSAWGAVLGVFKSGPQSQVAVPIADVDVSGWSVVGTKPTAWQAISDGDSSTGMLSPESPVGTTSGWTQLGPMSPPTSTDECTVTVTCRTDSASSGSIAPVLRSGTAAPFYTGTPQAITGALTTFVFTVPSSALSGVTNYDNWQIGWKPVASA